MAQAARPWVTVEVETDGGRQTEADAGPRVTVEIDTDAAADTAADEDDDVLVQVKVDDLDGLMALLLEPPSTVDLEVDADSLAQLVDLDAARVWPNPEEPRAVRVVAPVWAAGALAGLVVVSAPLPPAHGRTAWQLAGLRDVFAAVDGYRTQIRIVVRVLFWLFYAGVAGFALLVGYLLSRRLTGPLLRLVDGTQRVAAGDLDHRLDVASKDEIGRLMESFNAMTVQIKVNQKLAAQREVERQRAEAAQQAREQDLEVARLRERALQAENERQQVELQKGQELERAYRELEAAHAALQETQAQLLVKEKMASLGSLVAGVSHEINNPIGAVQSAVDVSQRCAERIGQAVAGAATVADLREGPTLQRPLQMLGDNLRVIRDAGQCIVTLARGLKSFARIDEAEMQMADVRDGLESALVLLQPQLPPGVRVERDLAPVQRTWCAAAQLNQVFMSLLTNAAAAVGEAGVIAVSTADEDGHLCVRVRDDGTGMSAEQLQHIFDLRLRPGRTRVKMGSGLWLAWRIVQEHGGDIHLDSAPGQGTTVTVRLPVRGERDDRAA